MALSYSDLPPRVLQFGGGNFLRAYLGWMVQHLNEHCDFEGSIVLVKPTPAGNYESLRAKAGQYHVVLNGIYEGEAQQIVYPIDCISQILNPYHEWPQFLATAKQPSLRYVVSNTTEAGIVFEGEVHYREGVPRSFPAKLTAWLYERFLHFEGAAKYGSICLPCELIPANGEALRTTILQYATHWGLGTAFESWIQSHNHFCDTLVDRIVSGYDADLAETLNAELAYEDPNLVVGEHYHSWVMRGPAGVEAQVPFLAPSLNNSWVEDLKLYRQRKVRILNGAHMTIVPLGYILGLKTVKEAMGHPRLNSFLEALLREEVIPSIDLEAEALIAYSEEILDRFRNPFLEHRLLDISLNSIAKFATRLMPSLIDRYQKTGQIPEKILTVWLAVILFYRGVYEGREIPLRDEAANLTFFASLWQESEAFSKAEILTKALQNPVWQNEQLPPRADLVANMLSLWQSWEQEGLSSLISNLQTSH
ncbi:MAG: tagaturonate reductase [Bacteroidota bacterium]